MTLAAILAGVLLTTWAETRIAVLTAVCIVVCVAVAEVTATATRKMTCRMTRDEILQVTSKATCAAARQAPAWDTIRNVRRFGHVPSSPGAR